nr:hypothetical protein [Tanacetum cinerariifolium]
MGNQRRYSIDVSMVSCYSDPTHENNQRKTSMWERICQMYDQVRARNPKDIGPRNENQMKGHFKRLSENGSKWVAAYTTASHVYKILMKKVVVVRKDRGLVKKEIMLSAPTKKHQTVVAQLFNDLLVDHLSPKEEDMKRNFISSDSDSSSISSNSVEYHEYESRVVQYNQHIDRILEDVIINYPNLVIQDQRTRSRRVYRDRKREQGVVRLMVVYFLENLVYDEVIFRRKFNMHKNLFFCIVDVVTANDRYFQQRVYAMGRLSLSPLQKCTTVIRVLAYGASFDVVDEYLRMSSAVTRKSLMAFV